MSLRHTASIPPDQRPATDDELHAWIIAHLGVTLTRTPLISGHAAPFDYIRWSFFSSSEPPATRHEGVPDAVVWANRGGGKTFLGAIATTLDLLFLPEIEIRVLGGSLQQASRMHAHLRRFFALPNLADLVAGRITDKRLRLTNGSTVELLAQSQTSVRGARVQKLRCDEVELFDPDVWDAAQLTTKSRMCGDRWVRGAIECLSTLHIPHGVMHRLVAEAREGRRHLFKWGVLDVLAPCEPDRPCDTCPLLEECAGRAKRPPSSPGPTGGGGRGSARPEGVLGAEDRPEGRSSLEVHGLPTPSEDHAPKAADDPRHPSPPPVLPGEAAESLEGATPQGATPERESWGAGFQPARPLPTFPDPSIRTPPPPSPRVDANVPAPGHIPIDDAIRMKARVSLPVWQSEMLCLRPRRDHTVLPEFDPALHIVREIPGLDTPHDLHWVAGMDFGYRAPGVILWAVVDDDHRVFIVDESVRTGLTTDQHAKLITDARWPRPRWVGADPAGNSLNEQTGRSATTVLRDAGLLVRSRRAFIARGLELLRRRLRPAHGEPTLFIHERCAKLIESLERYHYPENDPEATQPVKDGFDHAVDALRYLIQNLDHPAGARVTRYA